MIRLLVCLVLCSAVLAVTGCGSSDGETSGSAKPSATATPASTTSSGRNYGY